MHDRSIGPFSNGVHASVVGVRVVTEDGIRSAAQKIGQSLLHIANVEGGCGLGAHVAERFPVLEYALEPLGRALVRRRLAGPLVSLPVDGGSAAATEAQLHLSVAVRVLKAMPSLEQPCGPLAAVAITCALYGVGADDAADRADMTEAALDFLGKTIALQDLLDADSPARAGRPPGA